MKTPQVRYRGPNRNMRRNELQIPPESASGPSTEQNVAVIEEIDPGDMRMAAPLHQKHLIMTIKPSNISRNPPAPGEATWQTHGYD